MWVWKCDKDVHYVLGFECSKSGEINHGSLVLGTWEIKICIDVIYLKIAQTYFLLLVEAKSRMPLQGRCQNFT